jgi:preprotein translocase subunit YajC
MLVPVAAVIAVFYFVMLRPQQQQQQKHKQMLGALKKGDSVITQSGMFGKVVSIGEKDLILEISVGGGSTRVRWLKSQVSGLDPTQKLGETESSSDQKA